MLLKKCWQSLFINAQLVPNLIPTLRWRHMGVGVMYLTRPNCLFKELTHGGRVTHISVSKLTIIGSDNSLTPGRRQAIIWTNTGILLIGPLGTNFSEILIKIHTFSFKRMHLKMSSGKCRPFCFGLNVLIRSTKWRHKQQASMALCEENPPVIDFKFSKDFGRTACQISKRYGYLNCLYVMTSSNEDIVRVTDSLWGELTGHRWIPLTKASDAEL